MGTPVSKNHTYLLHFHSSFCLVHNLCFIDLGVQVNFFLVHNLSFIDFSATVNFRLVHKVGFIYLRAQINCCLLHNLSTLEHQRTFAWLTN